MGIHFDEQAALRRAYITLLELPHGGVRERIQSVLGTLLDEIAAGAGREPEEVQNNYEAFVAECPSAYVPSNGKRTAR